MYYTVIKHSSHLRTLEKCRKRFLHFPRVLQCLSCLSQCNTWLRLIYLLNNVCLHTMHTCILLNYMYIYSGIQSYHYTDQCAYRSPLFFMVYSKLIVITKKAWKASTSSPIKATPWSFYILSFPKVVFRCLFITFPSPLGLTLITC